MSRSEIYGTRKFPTITYLFFFFVVTHEQPLIDCSRAVCVRWADTWVHMGPLQTNGLIAGRDLSNAFEMKMTLGSRSIVGPLLFCAGCDGNLTNCEES